ncbi:beta-hydroxyacyl-ACP dehydratase [Asticcacaulis sp. BYS171W]|uniref:Beta-hydroxyacyl-ACP dehydratase n=1 Tax=Asticcacaulis aquaticus TaxID=2984212 RepID=A0ABT5HUT6_9CAUL|nr:3-hydroxyacyl-ACP dehydratase FabZ family protein [Asticcacaulis aquaticus]MDC7683739.1 beta-hydroxyacyl-ACP dehydratase [Asticcacaulis aquaticus]
MPPSLPEPPSASEWRVAAKKPLFAVADLPIQVRFGPDVLMRLLPHRGTFLLAHTITGMDLTTARLSGARVLDPEDPVFADHFPGAPVYPGVLLIEMAGQFGLCLPSFLDAGLVDAENLPEPSPVRLLRVRDALFVSEARPGDRLTTLVQAYDDGGFTFCAAAQVLCGDRVVCLVQFEAMIGDRL